MRGRTAVVTGGGRGIGAATAAALAAAGANVVVTARTVTEIEEVAAGITAIGGACLAVACDVSDPVQVAALAERARAEFGEVDTLISNAAVVDPMGPVLDADPAAWALTLSANVLSGLHCLQAFVPAMVAAGRGTVVAVSSSSSELPIPMLSAYAAGKAGFEALHRVAAAELTGSGVSVVVLWPGGVDTAMQARLRDDGHVLREPAKRVAAAGLLRSPDEVAGHIVELCRHAAAHHGQRIDLGEPT
jgi:NAD(P)-dependent dehydrogenase (short-subunit alcohol dehydrogenase family)